jgi:hypothetical protein
MLRRTRHKPVQATYLSRAIEGWGYLSDDWIRAGLCCRRALDSGLRVLASSTHVHVYIHSSHVRRRPHAHLRSRTRTYAILSSSVIPCVVLSAGACITRVPAAVRRLWILVRVFGTLLTTWTVAG